MLLRSLPSSPPSSLTSIITESALPSSSPSPSLLSGKSSCSRFTKRREILLLSSSLAASSLLESALPIPNPLQFHVARAEDHDESQQDEERVVHIFQEASPSVVFIKNLELQTKSKRPPIAATTLASPEDDDDWSDAKVEGTGSGFVWDKSGHIVTNYHVIDKLATDVSGLQRCKVFLEDADGHNFSKDGKLIGFDPAYDLAVLKVDVEGDKLRPALIGTSRDLRVGQSCFAIGNPYGYEHTLTTGVVSGLGREIPSPNGRAIRGAIQTDAAINAGNSGGPLIDSYGHVVGVNTATFTRKGTGVSSGVNFAIPIDVVVRTVPYLIVYGTDVDRF